MYFRGTVKRVEEKALQVEFGRTRLGEGMASHVGGENGLGVVGCRRGGTTDWDES